VFSMPDMAVVLLVVLIVFGAGKLPEIGSALGKGIKDFKKAVEEPPAVGEQQKIVETEAKPAVDEPAKK
jgi:sec-independent protein translocase protein TatA